MDATSLHAPVLSNLNLPWRKLIPQSIKLKSPPDAIIGSSPCSDFYYLDQGRVMILNTDQDGRQRIICYLEAGCLFNEAAAAAGFDAPGSPFVSASSCVYYRFPNTWLRDASFISKSPELISNLLNGLGIKVLLHHTSLGNFSGIPALKRISRFYLSLASKHGSNCFDPAMTQEAMAALLGMDRATIVRCLRELKERGIIQRSTKHCLQINDIDLLRKLAEN